MQFITGLRDSLYEAVKEINIRIVKLDEASRSYLETKNGLIRVRTAMQECIYKLDFEVKMKEESDNISPQGYSPCCKR